MFACRLPPYDEFSRAGEVASPQASLCSTRSWGEAGTVRDSTQLSGGRLRGSPIGLAPLQLAWRRATPTGGSERNL